MSSLRRLFAWIRGAHSERSAAALALDVASVAAFVVLWAGALALWLVALGDIPALAPRSFAIAIGLSMLPLGFAASDLATGLLHWFADTYFDEGTPILGPTLIYAFREHHRDPMRIAKHGFFEVSGNNALVCCLPAAGLLVFGVGEGVLGLGLAAFVLWSSFAIAFTNQFHRWAHARRAPRIVRFAQRRGLLLSPKAHSVHHARDHRRGYCVTVGWLNPSLDRLGFFVRLERGIARMRSRRAALEVR